MPILAVELKFGTMPETVWVAPTPDIGRALHDNGKGVPRGRIITPRELSFVRVATDELGMTAQERAALLALKVDLDGIITGVKRAASPPAVELTGGRGRGPTDVGVRGAAAAAALARATRERRQRRTEKRLAKDGDDIFAPKRGSR